MSPVTLISPQKIFLSDKSSPLFLVFKGRATLTLCNIITIPQKRAFFTPNILIFEVKIDDISNCMSR